MAKNLTGLHDTGEYSLGRGIVYLSFLDSNDKPGAWRDLGNCPEFNVTIERETLEHVSSRRGLQITDKQVTLSTTMNIQFALDSVNDQNAALFLSGETAAHTNAAVAGFSDVTISSSVELGRWYDLVDGSGARAYDIDKAKLTLEEVDGEQALSEGTDYVVDEEMGRVFILATASNIAAGEKLGATLTADATASSIDEVRGLTQGNVVVAIKFIGENPANQNEKSEYQFHKVTLSPDGDFALIGDDWTQMSFAGVVEDASNVDPASPFVRKRSFAAS